MPVSPQGSIERTAVRVTEQGFTDAEKVQARTNVGAISAVSETLTSPTLVDAILDVSVTFKGIQALTTAAGFGVVNVTTFTTKLTSTGTDALSLANGVNGQLKAIVHVVDGGDATLTPTTKTGFTTIVFSAVGQSVLLQYYTTLGWMVLSNNGAAVS